MSRLTALFYTILVLGTLILVFTAGFGTHWLVSQPADAALIGGDPQPSAVDDETNGFGVFWEAWNILERDFYGEGPTDQRRTYGAIKGLTQEYNDPYTYFIEPQPRQREKEELSGEFGGIGAWIYEGEDGAIRLNPMPGRPAEVAGLMKDDIIRAVDGEAISPETTRDNVVDMIRGPIGEPVALTVFRESTGEELTVEVMRDRIETPTVEWRMLEQDPQTGYIAIRLFGERTAGELDRALQELDEQGARQLVVDLRHNTGGLLQASVDVTSRFLNDGVVLFERRNDGSETTYRVEKVDRAPDWPMVALVDGATASAAEIMAGALQDRGRAALFGEKTFGKGSVQFVHDLSDGSSIHVTVAHWLTPNGHEINGIGLSPDRETPHEDQRDAPLEEAIRFLNGTQAVQR